mmetsp:Transcript_87828/g.268755  ORF Transcript_87828/g.268755 Transcript_87828/m.268755 type:complete len:203 (+) Transcript_87828:1427-2035(+)
MMVALSSSASFDSSAFFNNKIFCFRSSVERSFSRAALTRSGAVSWSADSSAWTNALCNLTAPPASMASCNSDSTSFSMAASCSAAFANMPFPAASGNSLSVTPAARALLMEARSDWIMPLSSAAAKSKAARCLSTSRKNVSSAFANTKGSTSARLASSSLEDSSSASKWSRPRASRSSSRAWMRTPTGGELHAAPGASTTTP